MKFLDIVNKHISILTEADAEQPPADAAAPDPNATAQQPAAPQQTQVLPEGYTDLVKLLVKATAMNFPPGALDKLYSTTVTTENAGIVRDAIKSAMKQYENSEDNLETLDNPHYTAYLESINTSNFYEALAKVANIIDPEHKILPKDRYVSKS